MNVAWDAYQMTEEAKANQSIDGFTPAQRFFISYGTIWRNNSRDKYIERQVKTDVEDRRSLTCRSPRQPHPRLDAALL